MLNWKQLNDVVIFLNYVQVFIDAQFPVPQSGFQAIKCLASRNVFIFRMLQMKENAYFGNFSKEHALDP